VHQGGHPVFVPPSCLGDVLPNALEAADGGRGDEGDGAALEIVCALYPRKAVLLLYFLQVLGLSFFRDSPEVLCALFVGGIF